MELSHKVSGLCARRNCHKAYKTKEKTKKICFFGNEKLLKFSSLLDEKEKKKTKRKDFFMITKNM